MVASLSFLLDCEKIEDDEDIDNSGSEDELATPQHQIVVSKEAIYKVSCSLLEFGYIYALIQMVLL